MTEERFIKHAGSDVAVGETADGGGMLLFGNADPDTVRLPSELGGNIVRVERSEDAPCPIHPSACGLCRTHRLAGNVSVAECGRTRQFFWYTTPPSLVSVKARDTALAHVWAKNEQTGAYVAEASTLDANNLQMGSKVCLVTGEWADMRQWAQDVNGGEISGWRYTSTDGSKYLIIND